MIEAAKQVRREVFGKIKRGVVAIAIAPEDPRDQQVDDAMPVFEIIGSGFVVNASGTIVTAKHVVQLWIDNLMQARAGKAPMAQPPVIVFPAQTAEWKPGEDLALGFAQPVHFIHATEHDLAVLQVYVPPDEAHVLTPLEISSEFCEEGDEVAVCGFPFGRNLHRDQSDGNVITSSFSQGIVSAVLPFPNAPAGMRAVFQLDCMVNGGNSGGPVFDPTNGKVHGVLISSFAPAEEITIVETTLGMSGNVRLPTGLARAAHIHWAVPHIEEIQRDRAEFLTKGSFPLGLYTPGT